MELQLRPWRLSLCHVLRVEQLNNRVHALLLEEPLPNKMGAPFKQLSQRAKGLRSSGGDSGTKWRTRSARSCTCHCTLKHPELQMGSLEHTCFGHSLLGVPASVQRAAIAVSMPAVWNGCWGGPFIKPQSPILSQTWLSSLHKAQLFVFCTGGDGVLTGSFEDFCHFHIHRTRGFNPRTRFPPHPAPYKFTLSTH